MTSSDSACSHPARLAPVLLLAIALFVLLATGLQFLRTDLDWVSAPLSFYLIGPYGVVLQAAYVALSLGLLGLGLGCYRSGARTARSGAPALLFAVAGIALTVTALAHTPVPRQPLTLEGLVHGVAAQTAFLCVTSAMLLQAWRWRADPGWRHRFAPAFTLALLCFIALWVHALWRELPRGASQKAVIALIACWLALVANWLRLGPRAPD